MRISDWSSDVCSSDLILPEGRYRLADGHPGKALFGWMSGQYRFDTYRSKREARGARVLLTADVAAIAPMVAEMRAVALVRDLVNKIGRASCRERVCKYVLLSVVAVSLKKKHKKEM